MKTTVLVLAVIMAVANARPAAADFWTGVNAYLRGDVTGAVRNLTPLAKKGEASAQNMLGWIYRNDSKGQDAKPDVALKWFRLAAEQGHRQAQFNLGQLYYTGEVVQRNYFEAARWFLKAAEGGNQTAQYYLARLYDVGAGVEKNATQAVRWWRSLADSGWPIGQYKLSESYRRGLGVEKSNILAYMWATVAISSGRYFPAKVLRDMISSRMSEEEIYQANSLAGAWKPTVRVAGLTTSDFDTLVLERVRVGGNIETIE